MARVIQNVPKDSANFCGAGGSVETLHPNRRAGGGFDKIMETVGDTGSGTSINKDVERIRVKNHTGAGAVRSNCMGLSKASIEACKGKQRSTEGTSMADTPPGEVPLAKEVLMAPQQEIKTNQADSSKKINRIGLC